MNELREENMEYVNDALGDLEHKEIMMNMSKARTFDLLAVSKLPLDTDEIGPSVVVLAEKIEANQGVFDGKDYLKGYKRLVEKAEFAYEFEDITKVKVGGKKMYLLKASVDYENGVVATQEFYSTMIDEYAFNFIVTYINDEDKTETDKILESVTIK